MGQLLQLARTENVTPETEQINLSRLVAGEALPFESVAFERGITLETDNSFAPEEKGIRTISVFTKVKNTDPHSSGSYPYVYGESLYKIFATEGIGELHN